MRKQSLAFALISIAATMWGSPEVAARRPRQAPSPWGRTESRRFDIHYQPALAAELDRVVRRTETAYDEVSGRLNFVLATKVPLIIFAPSGPNDAGAGGRVCDQ
jgi:hypothetical protein